jgi:predicted kinase
MESNISKPEWLTDEIIEDMRNDIAICSNPYTENDIDNLYFDGELDQLRLNAYNAIKTLTEYGIPLTETATSSKNVYIISGAVGSGKTTYVQNHMKQGDLVVDLDYICAALGATSELYNDHKPYLDIALAVRETVFQKIIKREGNWDNAFVITASKDMNKVRELAKTLDGKIVKMKATKEQCIANVRADSRRAENIELHLKLIEEWFDSNQ